MRDVTATDAARRFSELLDAVEHDEESFTIVRHGRAVARIVPATAPNGRAVRELLRRTPVDQGWAEDLAAVRGLTAAEERWPSD